MYESNNTEETSSIIYTGMNPVSISCWYPFSNDFVFHASNHFTNTSADSNTTRSPYRQLVSQSSKMSLRLFFETFQKYILLEATQSLCITINPSPPKLLFNMM